MLRNHHKVVSWTLNRAVDIAAKLCTVPVPYRTSSSEAKSVQFLILWPCVFAFKYLNEFDRFLVRLRPGMTFLIQIPVGIGIPIKRYTWNRRSSWYLSFALAQGFIYRSLRSSMWRCSTVNLLIFAGDLISRFSRLAWTAKFNLREKVCTKHSENYNSQRLMPVMPC